MKLEMLGYAVEYIEDGNNGFKTVLEACLDDLQCEGEMHVDKAKLEKAENSLKAGLRFLEMFKKAAEASHHDDSDRMASAGGV